MYSQMLVSACIDMNELDQAIAVFGLGEANDQWSKLVVALKQHGRWEEASNIFEKVTGHARRSRTLLGGWT